MSFSSLDQLYEGRNKALSRFGQSLVTFVLTFCQGRVEPCGLLLDPLFSETHLRGLTYEEYFTALLLRTRRCRVSSRRRLAARRKMTMAGRFSYFTGARTQATAL